MWVVVGAKAGTVAEEKEVVAWAEVERVERVEVA